MDVVTRKGNGHRYVLTLALPERSTIEVYRENGSEECILVPSIDETGVPAMSGHAPSMTDLKELVNLHIQYETATYQLHKANRLEDLGNQFGVKGLLDQSLFLAFRVLQRADEAGVLAPLLRSIAH